MSSEIAPRLRGAFTALITPFQDGKIDEKALRDLVDRQIEGKIDGLVPCGTTGEAATMSEDEQLEVIQIVVDQAAGRVPIIAGTGTNDTAKTVAYTQKVAAIEGVDAALVVVPYYNKPSQAMMLNHFRQVADNGGLPVVLYNVPGRTVVSMTPETIATLAEHENIVAVKEATGDMIFATRLLEALGGHPRKDFAMLSGDDFTTFPYISCGGVGCISVVSNLDPLTMHQLCAKALDGDIEGARALHLKIQPLARYLFSDSNPVPAKVLAHTLGWCSSECRAPLGVTDESLAQRAALLLQSYNL